MTPKQLTLEDIHGTDPLANFAARKFNLSPWGAGAFFLLAGIVYALILPRFWGYPLEINGNDLIYIFLVYPAAGYYYIYQPKSILRTYQSVARFLREEENYNAFHLDKIIKTHARYTWWMIGISFGMLGTWFGVSYGIEHFQEVWYNANAFEIFLVQSTRFLAYYCIGVSACRHIATSLELNNLFEHVDLPLTVDADRLGVFKSIRDFALEFVGVAAVIALNLGLQPLFLDPPLLEYSIYVSLYFIIAPFSFFLPIWEAHIKMTKIKNEMLDRLHYDFQEESQRLYRKFREDTKSLSYTQETEILNKLKNAIETVAHTADWPFQGTTIYRLVATVVSPFLLIIFEIFINIISNSFVWK